FHLDVGPLLAGLPIGVDLFAKLAPGCNLLLGHRGLFNSQKPRPRFACDSLRQAVVRAVAGFGIFVASADRLATLDRALGNRAPTHGLGLSQLGNELADTGWDFRRSGDMEPKNKHPHVPPILGRSPQEPVAPAAAVRAEIRKMDPNLPIPTVRTMREIL